MREGRFEKRGEKDRKKVKVREGRCENRSRGERKDVRKIVRNGEGRKM